MTLDVVICTRDRLDDLRRCIASVTTQTIAPRRILIVNGGRPLGSLAGAPEVVESEPGLPRQRNVALEQLDGEFVAFLDDDVELCADYLARVLDWFREHPETVGVSGHIDNDVKFSAASRVYRRVFSMSDGDGILQPSGDLIYLMLPSRPTRVHSLSGSNMVWRRNAIGDLRFDEALEGYGYMEDVDFSLRASRLGELWVLDDARLVHHRTVTSRVPTRMYVRQVISHGAYLFAKHRDEHALRRAPYMRRVAGRSIAYTATACLTRSREPLLGLADGLRLIPRMLRAGGVARRGQ